MYRFILFTGIVSLFTGCGKPKNDAAHDRCMEDASAECCADSECSDGYVCQVASTHSCYELCDTGVPDYTCEEDETSCSLLDFRSGDAITSLAVCH